MQTCYCTKLSSSKPCEWLEAKTFEDLCSIAVKNMHRINPCFPQPVSSNLPNPYRGTKRKNFNRNVSIPLLDKMNDSGFITYSVQNGTIIGVDHPFKQNNRNLNLGKCSNGIRHVQKASVSGMIHKDEMHKIIDFCSKKSEYQNFTISIHDGSLKYYSISDLDNELNPENNNYFVISSPILQDTNHIKYPNSNYIKLMHNLESELNDATTNQKIIDTYKKIDDVNGCTCNIDRINSEFSAQECNKKHYMRLGEQTVEHIGYANHHFSSYLVAYDLWSSIKDSINESLYNSQKDNMVGFAISDSNWDSNNLWKMLGEYYNISTESKHDQSKFSIKLAYQLNAGDIIKHDTCTSFYYNNISATIPREELAQYYKHMLNINHNKLFKVIDVKEREGGDYYGGYYTCHDLILENLDDPDDKLVYYDDVYMETYNIWNVGQRDEGIYCHGENYVTMNSIGIATVTVHCQ
jgi:hypothetical protein